MERRGDRITGSRLYRDFCASCKEPIRVAPEWNAKAKCSQLPWRSYCSRCDGHKPPPLAAHRPEGQSVGLGKTTS